MVSCLGKHRDHPGDALLPIATITPPLAWRGAGWKEGNLEFYLWKEMEAERGQNRNCPPPLLISRLAGSLPQAKLSFLFSAPLYLCLLASSFSPTSHQTSFCLRAAVFSFVSLSHPTQSLWHLCRVALSLHPLRGMESLAPTLPLTAALSLPSVTETGAKLISNYTS